MSDAINKWVEQLRSDDPKSIASAAQALAQTDALITSAAIPLASRVGTLDDDANEWMVAALERLRDPSSEDAAPLAQILKSYLDAEANALQAYWAATLIGRIGPVAAPASCSLLAECAGNASDKEVVSRSVWALAQFGAAAAPAQSTLKRMAETSTARTARYAQLAIDRIDEIGS